METKELIEKVRKSIEEYLKQVGWTQGNDQIILKELPNLWRKLETDGLMEEIKKKGMTYQHFVNVAHQKKQESDLMEAIRADIERFESLFRGNQ